MYIYRSPIGLMAIQFNPSSKMYDLYICDECYGSYHSPITAADDVYLHVTGCDEWDSLDGDYSFDVPTDLFEWDKA